MQLENDAARECKLGCLKALLEARADIHAKDKDKQTALHWAAKQGHKEIAQVLLDGGAQATEKDKDGKTPLDYMPDLKEVMKKN